MAFTRKALKAMGLTEEQVESIVEMHTEVTEHLISERDSYRENSEKYQSISNELERTKAVLAKYEENGETVPKSDFENLEREFNEYKNQQIERETRQAKETALRAFYKGIGISPKRIDSVVKVTDLDEIELDSDGKIKDAETRAESARIEWSDFIETTTTKGAATANPPANRGNGGTKTKAEILAIKDDAERQQAIYENKELFGF